MQAERHRRHDNSGVSVDYNPPDLFVWANMYQFSSILELLRKTKGQKQSLRVSISKHTYIHIWFDFIHTCRIPQTQIDSVSINNNISTEIVKNCWYIILLHRTMYEWSVYVEKYGVRYKEPENKFWMQKRKIMK